MREVLAFDDVLIVPSWSTVHSRKNVSLHTALQLKLPVISSNMDTVTGTAMVAAMDKAGGAACLHRFWSPEDNVKAFLESKKKAWVSLGLGDDELRRAQLLKDAGAEVFVIDVAHGANERVATQAKLLREIVGSSAIVVGNFATAESLHQFDLHSGGVADAFKIGIGGGSACTTRVETGCGMPTLASILDCARYHRAKGRLIADGGIRNPGDVAKALAAGAFAVMVGGMLAGTAESPGMLVHEDGKEFVVGFSTTEASLKKAFKKYRGSASKESYTVQGKDDAWRTAEGESYLVKYKGSAENVLQRIAGGLNSAFSYVGAHNLKEFQERAELVRLTQAGVRENGAHGK